MQKRILAIILVIALVFSLAACGGKGAAPDDTTDQDTNVVLPAPGDDENTPSDSNTPDADTPDNKDDGAQTPDTGKETEADAKDKSEDKPAASDKVTDKPASSTTETKPETKPEAKPEVKPAPQPENKPEVKPEIPPIAPIEPTTPPAAEPETPADNSNASGALSVIEKVWNAYSDDDKFSIVGGGYFEEAVENAPGKNDVSDAQALDSLLCVPQSASSMLDGAASFRHMFNANTFTAAAYHVKSGQSVSDFTSALHDSITQRHWVCGAPQKLVMYTSGNYVIAAYGAEDLIDTFAAAVTSADSSAKLVYEESL